MRKTMILAAFAALISLASCQKEEAIDNGTDKKVSPVFTASIAGATKTTIDLTEGKVAWEESDEITVTDASSASAVYTIESIDATTGRATFVLKSGETALGAGPYTATYGTEPAQRQLYATTVGSIYMTAPSTSSNSFTFTVQCGLMKLNLTKTGESVKSIAVTGTPTGGSEKTFILTCAENQSISTAKDFLISLPAGNYKNIQIMNINGNRCTLNSGSGVNVAANHIKPVTIDESKIVFKTPGPRIAEFSVGNGRKVHFSAGNLQAIFVGNGSYSWGFAATQSDYVGKSAGNITVKKQAFGDVVDLFGWSTSGTNYGINASGSNSTYSGVFNDWGGNIGSVSTWRTLTSEEWKYLFRKGGMFTYFVKVCGVENCVLIIPDACLNDYIFDGSKKEYNAAEWSVAEDAGIVCLPPSGWRQATKVNGAGVDGYYWSSTYYDDTNAYYACSHPSWEEDPSVGYGNRFSGFSVRLVSDVE